MLSGSQMMMRMLWGIGLIMLLVTSMFPGANPAWQTLVHDLSTGPNFPTNPSNPLALNSAQVTLHARANDTWGYQFENGQYNSAAGEVSPVSIFTDGSDPNCGQGRHTVGAMAYPGKYWPCVNTDDGAASGINLPGLAFTDVNGVIHNGYTWAVRLDNITGIDPQDEILNITLDVKCNTQTTPGIDFVGDILQNTPVRGKDDEPALMAIGHPDALSIAHLTRVGTQKCDYGGPITGSGVGPNFFNVRLVANFQNGIMVSSQRIGNFTHTSLMISSSVWGQLVSISYLTITVYYLNENASTLNQQCGTFDIGCTVTKIWNAAVGFLIFVVGAASSAGQWLWAVITFGVSIIVNFVLGFIEVLIWMMTMPGLGVPPIVQGFIDVAVIGWIGYSLYEFLKILRGGGGA